MRGSPHGIEKFLGLPELTDDSCVLLGLRNARPTEGEVVTALQSRLTQIAAHADGLTPEADEVRLKLHAAAAKLLVPSANKPQAPVHDPERTPSPEPSHLEAAIILTLASMGGWNARSKERIALLAHSHGVSPEHVVELAESLAGRPGVRTTQRPALGAQSIGGAPATTIGARSAMETEFSGRVLEVQQRGNDFEPNTDPANRLIRNIVIFGAVALFGSAALVVLSVTIWGKKPIASETPVAPQTAAATVPSELFPTKPREEKPKTEASSTRPPPARIGDWDDLLRAASASVAGLETSPEAAFADFEKVYARMSSRWGETSGDGLVAGVDRLVEFIYRAAAHEGLAARAVEVVIAGTAPLKDHGPVAADHVLPSAWASGVLARVGRERDLSVAVRNRVLEAMSSVFPGSSGPGEPSFQAGCTAALVSISRRLTSQDVASDKDVQLLQDAWREWLKGLAAVTGPESPAFTRQVVLAIDGLLTLGPDPTKSRAAFQTISNLTIAVPWRKEDETRQWLMRWFDSEDVTDGDLYVVTAALAGQSGAEGVDGSMVISAGAGTSQRAEMRDRYAAMWGLATGISRETLLQRWADAAANRGLPNEPIPSTPVLQVHELLVLAGLNHSAMQLWLGEVEGVDISVPAAPVDTSTSSGQLYLVPGIKPKADSLNANINTDWVRDYLSAGQNIPQRRELIARINMDPDTIMSEILVEEACRGTPYQVRQDARAKVVQYLSSPPILNALLEFAPLMPITRENAALVEQATFTPLPNLRDPTWRVAVRRALVETLLQVLAGKGALAYIDSASERLAELYAVTSVSDVPQAAPPEGEAPQVDARPPPPAPALDVAVKQHRLKWQREAELLVPSAREPYNLSQMERRRRARSELASGKVQEFEAEQLAICELMAYVCVCEQPSRAAGAAQILSDLEEQRRRCKSVFEQLLLAERARLRLWTLRMSEKHS